MTNNIVNSPLIPPEDNTKSSQVKQQNETGKYKGLEVTKPAKLQRTNAQKKLSGVGENTLNTETPVRKAVPFEGKPEKNVNQKEKEIAKEKLQAKENTTPVNNGQMNKTKEGCEILKHVSQQLKDYGNLIGQVADKHNHSKGTQLSKSLKELSSSLQNIITKIESGTGDRAEIIKSLELINSRLRNYIAFEYVKLSPDFKNIEVKGLNMPQCIKGCGQQVGKAQLLIK